MDLPLTVDSQLQAAALQDQVTPAMRIRAMAEVWASDETTRQRVDEAAQQLRSRVKTRQRQRAAEMRDRRWPPSAD